MRGDMTRGMMAAIAIVGLSVSTGARQTAPAAGFTRTQLQDRDLSIKGRHAVMARSEFQPGAESGRHFHPGEEMGYVLEGTLELTIDTAISSVMDYFEIFLPRMMLSRRAAEFLHCNFALVINNTRLL